ncbi:MAG: hypothetical protein ACHQQS_02995 [Thermoanaerobaculales bacterium]
MTPQSVRVRLDAWEWKLVSAMRDIPPSPLRDLVHELTEELAAYVCDPHCPELQADGAPCESAEADCEQCLKVKELLLTLRRRLTSR